MVEYDKDLLSKHLRLLELLRKLPEAKEAEELFNWLQNRQYSMGIEAGLDTAYSQVEEKITEMLDKLKENWS